MSHAVHPGLSLRDLLLKRRQASQMILFFRYISLIPLGNSNISAIDASYQIHGKLQAE